MPISCCVKNCKSKWKAGCGISFFRFPFKDKQRLQLWISAVGRDQTWRPTATSKICSLHFSNTNIISDFGYQNNHLKPTAVPLLFPACIDVDNRENISNAMEKRQKIEENKNTENNTNVMPVESYVHVSDTSIHQSARVNATEIISFKQVADKNISDCIVTKQKSTIIPEQHFYTFQMKTTSNETSTIEDSPSEEIKTLHKKINKLSRQVKTLKQTLRRRDQKIKNMELFKANLIDKDFLMMILKNRLEEFRIDFATFANRLKNKNQESYSLIEAINLTEFYKKLDLKESFLHYICDFVLEQLMSCIDCKKVSTVKSLIVQRTEHDYCQPLQSE